MRRRDFVGALGSAGFMRLMGHARTQEAELIDSVDLSGAPGISVGVVHAGRVLALGGSGERGSSDLVVPGPDSMFEIGSLTKTFTACLVFELATEGRLDINMPVGSYLEDLPVEWRRRSLATLLSHTSGLPEYLDASNFRALMPMALTPRGIVDIAAKRPILFSAGKEYAYNNTGYVLLGMVAEAVGKASFWQQLRARFFEPTGMNRTGPRGLINSDGDLATGHFWDGAQWDNSPPITAPGSTFSAGGLLSTSRDLARWAVALDEGRVVGSKARQKMWSRAILADGRPIDWGYGWKIEGEGDQRVVAHGGGTAGFSCWLSRDLATETTTFVLTNQNGRADPAVMASALQAASEKLLGR